MNIHSRARTCPESRALLVERVADAAWSVDEAAEAAGISRRTVFKWLRRYRGEGRAGLLDQSSRPIHQPSATPEDWRNLIFSLRRLRLTGAQIAARLKLARSTVARILSRAHMGRLKDLEPRQPVVRYERRLPGELLHLDIKKLARIHGVGHRITGDRTSRKRGIGWEFVHVCVDDASRLAYVEVLDSEAADRCVGFLLRALAFYRNHDLRIRSLITDNAFAYRAHSFQAVCQRFRIRQLRTRPYRPQTNGKAERFIQTLLREWAYARAYSSSRLRTAALARWLWRYNHRRPHGSLNGEPPISRVHRTGEQRA